MSDPPRRLVNVYHSRQLPYARRQAPLPSQIGAGLVHEAQPRTRSRNTTVNIAGTEALAQRGRSPDRADSPVVAERQGSPRPQVSNSDMFNANSPGLLQNADNEADSNKPTTEPNGKPASTANFIAAGYIKSYVVGKRPIGYTCLYTSYDCENARQASVQVIAKEKRLEWCGTELPLLNILKDVPGIMSTLEICEHGESLLAFKEACWIDMHSHLRDIKRMTEDTARELFYHIVRTVASCHEKNIVLRDLKLNNIVFTTPSCTTVKVTSLDMAVSVTEDNDLLFEQPTGLSPAYTAPECLQKKPYSGKKADSWSLGIILYAMVVGTYPFTDDTTTKLEQKILSGKYNVPSNLSVTVRCLLSSLLRTSPAMRPVPAEVLRHPFLVRASTSAQNYHYDYQTSMPGGLTPGGFDHFSLSEAAQRSRRRNAAGVEVDEKDQMVPGN
eukprot:comp23036_c0_seq1/m.36838 comp23036_c0_seq1/g.36838  ORF comp23036_c0_seq1/g.36838 comp23036_c0_seq1/m.36838 type:complete len:442 (-) comp23036_c0_seq1:869-2194(-)